MCWLRWRSLRVHAICIQHTYSSAGRRSMEKQNHRSLFYFLFVCRVRSARILYHYYRCHNVIIRSECMVYYRSFLVVVNCYSKTSPLLQINRCGFVTPLRQRQKMRKAIAKKKIADDPMNVEVIGSCRVSMPMQITNYTMQATEIE